MSSLAGQILGGGVTLLVGAGFLLIAWGTHNHRRYRQTEGVHVPGVIVGHRWGSYGTGEDANAVMVPVVQFQAPDGTVREFVHRAGTNVHQPVRGARVTVWYHPDDPSEPPVIEGDAVMGCLPWLFGAVGLIAVLVGGGLVVSALLGG